MTDKKVTGVFVHLPLSDEDCMTIRKHITSKCLTNDGIVNGLLAIGTPVTGGELYPIGYIDEDAIGGLATGVYQSASIFRDEDVEHHDTVALTRQSDALAKLAEKDAEIEELREAERHARADAEAAKARVERLRKIVDVFSAKISECASEGYDLSYADCLDLLDEAGVIEWGTFDPEVHDHAIFDGCERGDPIWTLKGPEA